ncbi:hypothetical protein [Arcobacter sp.]|uniref:hypothetical protein n=1 Tax=Arcobacter sp. TaxID=1872629 RepID=UPI003C77EFBE
MKLKFSLFCLFFLFTLKLFSYEVIIAKIDIPFRSALTPSNVAILQIEKLPDDCKPISLKELKGTKYFTSKYLQKDKVICHSDLKKEDSNRVIFNFGSIQIETPGKIMYENDEYIKIRKQNGKVEKIYKDGRDK